MRIRLLAVCVTYLACGETASLAAEKPLADKVGDAIRKGIGYLRDAESGRGDFESDAVPLNKARPGSVTALAVLALLKAGVPADDPLMQRCLKYLRGLESSQSYTVGLQTAVFCLTGQKQDRPLVRRNLKWITDTRLKGGWGYDSSYRSPDHSINEYILLGVHEAWRAGFEVDRTLLGDMYDHYLRLAPREWGYRNISPSLTMTTAVVSNLMATSQALATKKSLLDDGSDRTCGEYNDAFTASLGLCWIGKEFSNAFRKAEPSFRHPFYSLHGLERAGRLTGRRFFGDKDWYHVGCEYLVSIQEENGSWNGHQQGFDYWPPVATSLALLFLSEGRTPVLVSKLAFHVNWNRKRSDMRHVVEYASRELFEKKHLTWQLIDWCDMVDVKTADLSRALQEAPVLFLNGHSIGRVLLRKEEALLKQYLANGGFIFAEACCNSKPFDVQFRAIIKKVTGSELTPLGKDHPVWKTSKKYTLTSRDCPLEGIQKGGRTIVIYSPRALAGYWENNDTTSEKGKKAFQLATNVIAYATQMKLPKPRP
jgi:hypothetical protein